MRVSVIVPTYNRAGYLREALESIFSQTLPAWEVIVVDDGSTEDIAAVAVEYGDKVRYIRHEGNLGVSAARNSGLSAARGDVIAWLDSDDLWEPDFLATVVPLLTQDPTLDGVYTGITMIDEEGARRNTSTRTEPPDALYDALVRACFLATPSIVVRKACYDLVGGFDLQLRIGEDADMWLRLARQFRLVGIAAPLVRIRVHASNIMSDIEGLCRARLAVTRKHFGDIEEGEGSLSEPKRAAYGYAYRSISLRYIEGGQSARGWTYLGRAAALYPELLGRLDTFYELACGDQPRSHRGHVSTLDLDTASAELMAGLEQLFAVAPSHVGAWRRAAFGNAYLALAMLNDQAGRWRKAWVDIVRAVAAQPRLLRDALVWRRFLKLSVGKHGIHWLQRLCASLRGGGVL